MIMSVSRPKPDLIPRDVELLDGRKVPLRVIVNPRARRISLRVDPAAQTVIAVAPNARAAQKAAAFAQERIGWIALQVSRLPQSIPLTPGNQIPLRGAPHLLVWGDGVRVKNNLGLPPSLTVGAPDEAVFAQRIRRFLINEARMDLTARVDAHSTTLGVKARRLSVKDTKSRWGSCTSNGALSFSWRVILAPPFVLDYLAAHEVAHLKEMNHSPRFWALVGQCIPDYERAEEWLRRHGGSLHSIGPLSL
jgi:predicted metal-dependent hydrolase